MTITIAAFDAMPEAEAAFKLAACCGSSTWVSRMLVRRPFRSRDHLFNEADEVAQTLGNADWLEAFSHHPRIGQRRSNAAVSSSAESWSIGEQSAVFLADTAVRAAIADANARYEELFHFIFIISASGRTAASILDALRVRLANSREAEIRIAAGEQQKITRLRLEKLVTASAADA
ncbi:2-oxo-4-hydroxy-4-carboxy-5-ureidoimidazoline decarboxylase [soil metagenome]